MGILKAVCKRVAGFFPTCFRQENLNCKSIWGRVNFLHLQKILEMLSLIADKALTVKMKGNVCRKQTCNLTDFCGLEYLKGVCDLNWY